MDKKEMMFFGTAAAECYPNPFCSCPSCNLARESNDPKLTRRRSSFFIDEYSMIDFGADAMHAANQYKVSLAQLDNVFLTHMHEDHFDYFNVAFLQMSVTREKPLNIYTSQKGYDGIREIIDAVKNCKHTQLAGQFKETDELSRFIVLKPYSTYEIGNLKVSTVVGRHDGFFNEEKSLNYVFERKNKLGKVEKFMYASDTGRFLPETMEYLKNASLDKLIIEGSFGKTALDENSGHMYCQSLIETIHALYQNDCINNETKIFVTHIGHKGIYNHYDYETALQNEFGENISLAYDGLMI